MDCVTILAETVLAASQIPEEAEETIVPIELFWQYIT
jgi:hypothetical protein